MGDAQSLKRILGTPTAILIGMGVAIGSGIFRTPGDIAKVLHTPGIILAIWAAGGIIALMQSLVTAELATRFPKAGGEYVYLKEAYGEFVAFFFGWVYTIFIIGGAMAVVSLAFGEFACELFELDGRYSGACAAAAVIVVTAVNAAGLRAGSGAQNTLTILKIVALMTIVAVGLIWNSPATGIASASSSDAGAPSFTALLAALVMVLWSYDGTTDAVKLAEEVKDVRRALPRALVTSALSIAALYLLVNLALLRVLTPEEIAGRPSALGDALARLFGPGGAKAVLVVAMLACLGSVSSMVPAAVRVTFALSRDGLTFRFMSRMSKSQAPVGALLVVAGFALVLVTQRDFASALGIYYMVSTVLFGLAYASLIVFRFRESRFPAKAFRCPVGPVLAAVLIVAYLTLAVNIAIGQGRDALLVGAGLAFFVPLYFVWKRFAKPTGPADSS